ncbi:MAG: hypothetical protein LBL21_03635 [Rickettsiales bacterium]|nr:hypothetical protein [Rickettsiales bacterium]
MKRIKKYFSIMASVFMMTSASSLPAATVCAPTANIAEAVYPVGAVYISTSSADPAALFGFGTWERFGNGKALVGVEESETEFDTVEKTGGEKTHTLTVAEMPSHNHSGTANSAGSHVHGIAHATAVNGNNAYSVGDGHAPQPNTKWSYPAGEHTHDLSVDNIGGSQTHNNLQPYITVYIWRRVS